MSPARRRRFGILLAVDGLGTAAYCMRAVLRPHDPVPLVDAAGAVLGWSAAAVVLHGLRELRADLRGAARWIVAGTAATVGAATVDVRASRRAGRPAWPSLLLLATGAALGGAYLRVLAADDGA